MYIGIHNDYDIGCLVTLKGTFLNKNLDSLIVRQNFRKNC